MLFSSFKRFLTEHLDFFAASKMILNFIFLLGLLEISPCGGNIEFKLLRQEPEQIALSILLVFQRNTIAFKQIQTYHFRDGCCHW